MNLKRQCMFKILITDSISDNGLKILEDDRIKVMYKPDISNEELDTILPEINGWIIRSGTTITAKNIKDANKLSVIGRAGVGVDNIDIQVATNAGVVVMNLPDGNTISAAEHTMSLLSALSRNVHIGHLFLIKGEWKRNELVGNELKDKILGVVGLGKIGKEVIKRALSYDMKVLGHDPFINQDMIDPETVKIVDIDELTKKSDFITLHVPLTDSTRNLFNLERIKQMKPTSRIINVARGGIINEKDLSVALNNNTIAGAAIDVFEKEPLVSDHPFLETKNLLITPHLGASTIEAKEGVSKGICQQVMDFLIDQKLSNVLNIPISDMSILKQIEPYLNMTEKLGILLSQLINGPVKSVKIECFGLVEELKPISISFLKGLFSMITDNRINFVNAISIAEERGISISHSYSSQKISYSNLITANITTSEGEYSISGSVFSENHPRIVRIMGYVIDIFPEGVMLFMQNKDVPGVIGKIGTLLGNNNINIASYILSREIKNKSAYSIVKVDEKINDEIINEISLLEEIEKINQIELK